MIAPILPGAEKLIDSLSKIVNKVIVDKMNYHHANAIYKKHDLEKYKSNEYFSSISKKIKSDCSKLGIECQIVF